jgi:hypothetical protein
MAQSELMEIVGNRNNRKDIEHGSWIDSDLWCEVPKVNEENSMKELNENE